jgi:hypothetical protein
MNEQQIIDWIFENFDLVWDQKYRDDLNFIPKTEIGEMLDAEFKRSGEWSDSYNFINAMGTYLSTIFPIYGFLQKFYNVDDADFDSVMVNLYKKIPR